MKMDPPVTNPASQQETSFLELLLRLYWICVGHTAVFLVALYIYLNHLQSSLVVNVVFFVFLIGLPVSRFLDIVKYRGQTAEGEPATMAHWKKFTLIVSTYGILLWLTAQIALRLIKG